ncbi:MAG: RNA methyltransferase [Ideonella sp.]|nr:RNA methyltransferase [Ideonella sp.]MCC7459494.1 RNA methyltransferase [Nitrospira sp.]
MTAPTRSRITSRDNALLVRVRRLNAAPDAYRKLDQVWLEGDHLLRAAAARAQPLQELLVVASREHDPDLRDLIGAAARVRVVDDALWSGIGALSSKAPVAALVAWPGPLPVAAGRRSVVLDRLQDAGNVGSILRSAAAFGVEQVVALQGCAALWSPKVVRAAMGAHFALRLVEAVDASALAALGVPLVATSPHAPRSIVHAALPRPCAWVFGHEGQGVSSALLARCALQLAIPQPGGEESLNVAAAAAVCLYESARRVRD